MIGYTNSRRGVANQKARFLARGQTFNDLRKYRFLNYTYLQKYQQKASYGPYHSYHHHHVIPKLSRHWLLPLQCWLLMMARDLIDASYWRGWKPMKLLEVKGHLLAMCQDLDRKLDSRVLIGSIAMRPFDFGFPKKILNAWKMMWAVDQKKNLEKKGWN